MSEAGVYELKCLAAATAVQRLRQAAAEARRRYENNPRGIPGAKAMAEALAFERQVREHLAAPPPAPVKPARQSNLKPMRQRPAKPPAPPAVRPPAPVGPVRSIPAPPKPPTPVVPVRLIPVAPPPPPPPPTPVLPVIAPAEAKAQVVAQIGGWIGACRVARDALLADDPTAAPPAALGAWLTAPKTRDSAMAAWPEWGGVVERWERFHATAGQCHGPLAGQAAAKRAVPMAANALVLALTRLQDIIAHGRASNLPSIAAPPVASRPRIKRVGIAAPPPPPAPAATEPSAAVVQEAALTAKINAASAQIRAERNAAKQALAEQEAADQARIRHAAEIAAHTAAEQARIAQANARDRAEFAALLVAERFDTVAQGWGNEHILAKERRLADPLAFIESVNTCSLGAWLAKIEHLAAAVPEIGALKVKHDRYHALAVNLAGEGPAGVAGDALRREFRTATTVLVAALVRFQAAVAGNLAVGREVPAGL